VEDLHSLQHRRMFTLQGTGNCRKMFSEGCIEEEVFYAFLTAYLFCTCFYFALDSFVNSQEWTLSRTVPDLKLVSHKRPLSMIYKL